MAHQHRFMSQTLISDLKRAEEQKHLERMRFFDDFEAWQQYAASFGYTITLSTGPTIASPPEPYEGGGLGIPKKADLRIEDDSMKFETVADAINYALARVGDEFSTGDVLGEIRRVAPAFYNNRDLSSFSHQLKKQTQGGNIRMILRGAGNRSSRYLKVTRPEAAPDINDQDDIL